MLCRGSRGPVSFVTRIICFLADEEGLCLGGCTRGTKDEMSLPLWIMSSILFIPLCVCVCVCVCMCVAGVHVSILRTHSTHAF